MPATSTGMTIQLNVILLQVRQVDLYGKRASALRAP
jgi:hypothetical protein